MAAAKASPRYNEVVCIGLGLAGINVAVQLKRKFGFTDMHLYDRNESYSGTWWLNHYPGAACDVPALFYSYSFERNPGWSKLLPTYDEIRQYVDGVVEKYQLRPYMTFSTLCESATWDSTRCIWTVHLHDLVTGERYTHECRVLYSAVGLLVDPKVPGIPGSEKFEGPSFHTARWRDDVDLTDKNVIVVGNGCSASQVVPRIVSKTKTLTQFINTPHWLLEMDNIKFTPSIRWVLRYVPLIGRAARLAIYIWSENAWRLFVMNKSGARLRRDLQKQSKEYMLRMAPEKYHDILIPDWEIACKRRIFDADSAYLKSLHAPNLLLTKDPIVEIGTNSVRTATKTYDADVIVWATGFVTNKGLGALKVQGRGGEWLSDHWAKMGGPSAYHSTCVHGYPNFFILYGPNSNTGHSSVVMTTENAVNYSLKLIAPILRGEALAVEVTEEAATEYSRRVQATSKTRLFSTCRNWYVTEDGWNGTTYPWSQLHFWWRSVFPIWRDLSYKYTPLHSRRVRIRRTVLIILFVLASIGAAGIWSWAGWYTSLRDMASVYVQTAKGHFGI